MKELMGVFSNSHLHRKTLLVLKRPSNVSSKLELYCTGNVLGVIIRRKTQ